MKLIFSGNAYKYETEAIMKLFLPAQRFEFFYGDSDEGKSLNNPDIRAAMKENFAFLRKRVTARHTLLYAYVNIDGKSARHSVRLDISADDGICEFELSKLLYLSMNRLTGISSQWGILTGVRPVKQVHKLLEKGMTRDEVFAELKEKYLVSEQKCAIAYDTATVQQPMLDSLENSGGRTFGLYISIPFCPTRCSYCSFISQSAQGASVKKLISPYIENLCIEIKHTAEIAARLGLKPDTVYFGGGTPTVLSAEQLARIMRAVADGFDMSAVKEYTVEAGRPDTVTAEKLTTMRENGCTRISINPQTLSDSVLKTIGRSHTTEQFYQSFALAREAGFDSINTDVIAGLPGDTPEGFSATIDGLIKLSPESITVHTLSIKRSANLNADDYKREILHNPAGIMVGHATERLYGEGYKPYYMYRQKNTVGNLENIGWVKPGFESLYNIYIMEEVQTIIALGAAASTKLVDRQGGRIERIFNYKYPIDYNNNLETMLKRKNAIEDFYAEKE